MKVCKRFLGLLILFLSTMALPLVGQGKDLHPEAAKANRRTALRSLELAKDYAAKNNWQAVISQVSLGISYDETISDLWYMMALASFHQEKPRAQILAYVKNAIEKQNWASYNYDSARVLYADMLCDTLQFDKVPSILDASPLIFSADAEYVRAKAYYRLGDPESLQKARVKVENARKIYPDDIRFPLLFFKYESPLDTNGQVRDIARSLIERIASENPASADHSDENIELEIYAALFAEGNEQKRLLQSFNGRNLRHPLYATAALKAGLISEQAGLEYLGTFASWQIDYEIFSSYISSLQDPAVIDIAISYLKSFTGGLVRDTDGDGIPNLIVKYSRGRPQSLSYDGNQDQVLDWNLICDFGSPIAGSFHIDATSFAEFDWDSYPYLKSLSFKEVGGVEKSRFDFVPKSLKWTPASMERDEKLSLNEDEAFYFPVVNSSPLAEGGLESEKLASFASHISIPSKERENARIYFYILNGKIQSADYMQGSRLYARAEFKNDMPSVRVLDSDGDGIFETTEIYEADKSGSMDVHSMEDERNIMINVLGSSIDIAPWYLKMVQYDSNNDATADFTEQYFEHGGKISSWDNNGDGQWDIRYVLKARADDKSENAVKEEEALFYDNNKKLVHVFSKNGSPYKVIYNSEELSVTQDPLYKFYWLGQVGNSSLAKKMLVAASESSRKGVAVIVSDKGQQLMGIKIGDEAYGIIVKEHTYDEKK